MLHRATLIRSRTTKKGFLKEGGQNSMDHLEISDSHSSCKSCNSISSHDVSSSGSIETNKHKHDHNHDHDSEDSNYHLDTCTRIYIYILDTVGCLNLCKSKIGIKKVKQIKMKLDQAQEYLDHDFNINKLVVFMKTN